MSKLIKSGLLLATVSLATALISCGGSSKSYVVAAVPTFTDESQAAGFVVSHGKRAEENDCLFNPVAIKAAFPKVTPPNVARDLSRQCDPERSAGGAAAIDVNGDGLDDIIFTRLYDHPLLYINKSTKKKVLFVDETKGSVFEEISVSTNGVAAADIDKDGDQDIVVTSLAGKQLYLFVNDGNGKFTEQAVKRGVAMIDGRPHSGMGISFGDYDNDGWIDFHTSEWQTTDTAEFATPSHSRLFRNLGASGRPGFFEDTTEKAGVKLESRIELVYSFSSSFTDFDGDGFVDLAIALDFGQSRFYWNNGDGTFTNGTVDADLGKEENGMGMAVGFFGRQQQLAMLVTSIRTRTECNDGSSLLRTGNRLYFYSGERKFAEVTDEAGIRNSNWGWGVNLIDTTNAGKRDVVSAAGMAIPWRDSPDCWRHDPIRLWLDDGSGNFSEKAKLAGITNTEPSKGVIVFDADNDGRQDLFITRDANTPLFLHNTTAGVGKWLGVKVLGSTSNADALGAKITVTPIEGTDIMKAFVGTTGSFLTQDGQVTHFGLNNFRGKVDSVKVEFPASKKSVVLTDVEPNQVLTIKEP
jgi:hypothetical protein